MRDILTDDGQRGGVRCSGLLCPSIFSCACTVVSLCVYNDLDFHRLATYGLAELQMEGDGNCQV